MVVLLAIYPYTVVGKPPGASDWDSRFQLLYPLGIAFMICPREVDGLLTLSCKQIRPASP